MPKLIRIDESQAKEVTHKECGAVIKYYLNEVKSTADYDTDYIICPNPKCKKRVSVRGY